MNKNVIQGAVAFRCRRCGFVLRLMRQLLFLVLGDQNDNFFNEASAQADMKHSLRSYDALTFVRMKRSAD
jgi:hypothetical protein